MASDVERAILTGEVFTRVLDMMFEVTRLDMGDSATWVQVARAVHADFAARYEHLYVTTENPLWVYRFMNAASCIRQKLEELEPQPDLGLYVQPLPRWCEAYQLRSAQRLAYLSDGVHYAMPDLPVGSRYIGASQASQLVTEALGLTRPGWNAFHALRGQMRDDLTLAVVDLHSETTGSSKSKKIEELAEKWEVDTRQLRRRMSDARKRAKPRG